MAHTKTAARKALVAFLDSVPEKSRPAIFPKLRAAAKRVSTGQEAAVIATLMGPANYIGSDLPKGPLKFPADHALHLRAGTEWYWVSANLEVEGSGGADRIGILSVINRGRAVSNAVQKSVGWTDAEAQVVDSAATITVATREDGFIIRRRPNVCWAALGDKTRFDANPFHYQAGPDSMRGSENVLPLAVHIDDGPDFEIDITLDSDLAPDKSFFLQGADGITPVPKPGIYYSWPQLSVTGTVTARGKKYIVTGKGWIDHQLMMPSLPGPQLPQPAGWAPVDQFNGWNWCQFNLDNGDAFTVAAFQVGSLRTTAFVPYGWYLRRLADGWDPIYVVGSLELDRFLPLLEQFVQPSDWTYKVTDAQGSGAGVDIALHATPWYPDGSFHTGNLEVPGEAPVTVAMVDRAALTLPAGPAGPPGPVGPGVGMTGSGYCETVGFEPPAKYVARALAWLDAAVK